MHRQYINIRIMHKTSIMTQAQLHRELLNVYQILQKDYHYYFKHMSLLRQMQINVWTPYLILHIR